jgi:hypothetical protein
VKSAESLTFRDKKCCFHLQGQIINQASYQQKNVVSVCHASPNYTSLQTTRTHTAFELLTSFMLGPEANVISSHHKWGYQIRDSGCAWSHVTGDGGRWIWSSGGMIKRGEPKRLWGPVYYIVRHGSHVKPRLRGEKLRSNRLNYGTALSRACYNGFRDKAVSLYTVQTSNTPCPHTSCFVHWCWRWNFRKCIILGKLYQLCHVNNKYRY